MILNLTCNIYMEKVIFRQHFEIFKWFLKNSAVLLLKKRKKEMWFSQHL